ncbi:MULTISPECIES: hypothetical protein [Paenibacillus]|uniref:Uncharacterized protein n=1 Tax=Paenibacillus albilobatus TaxID=2716884 RepID=A0A919XHE9_9BACL|nr:MULTISPECIES: hypothetical protein [Paenibacillus]GIO32882.1 hypothetical protein J2TS6_40230 [Paenibacillus albilobatus]
MDVTANPYETYNQLINAEDRLLERLEACELAQSSIFDLFFKSEGPLSREGVEEILQAVHAISLRLQSELLALRLEKKTVARQLKKFT